MLNDIKDLFSLSFKITNLKEEEQFLIVLNSYEEYVVSEKLSKYLFETYLISNLVNYRRILLSLSEFGMKALTNWKLSFPVQPTIETFDENSINKKLASFENQLTVVLFKILIFLRDNFKPISNNEQKILLPLLSAKIVDNRFSKFNTEYKVIFYQRYLEKIEKILILKYLLKSNYGEVIIDFNSKWYQIHSADSNLTKLIGLKNNEVLEKLRQLSEKQSITYEIRTISIEKQMDKNLGELNWLKAFKIEKQYSKDHAMPLLKFKESECENVLKALLPYFHGNDHKELENLIHSRTNICSSKLCFQQTSTTLTYFFKTLYKDQILIANSKQTISSWMINNFKYQYAGVEKNFSENTIQKTLMRDSKEPKLVLSIS